MLCLKQTKTNATTIGESFDVLVYIISLFTFLCGEEDQLQKEGALRSINGIQIQCQEVIQFTSRKSQFTKCVPINAFFFGSGNFFASNRVLQATYESSTGNEGGEK